jgi:putative transposase
MHKKRKNTRLRKFDYSSEHQHFITICTYNRECLFGRLENSEMILSEIGNIANLYWTEIPDHFPHVILDEFIVMPNHIHGIIKLNYSNGGKSHNENIPIGPCHGMDDPKSGRMWPCHGMALFGHSTQIFNKFGNPVSGSVSVVINQYKSAVKRWCNKNGHNIFTWQTRFYDHIINNRRDLERIRKYILSNPEKMIKTDE